MLGSSRELELMQFKLEIFHRDISDEDLLADLRRVESSLKTRARKLSFRAYRQSGKYSSSTIAERFGSWNKALLAAGLGTSPEKNISVDVLFDNLKDIWLAKGAQPKFRDMSAPPSRYNAKLYAARFGTWRKALEEFVSAVQSSDWVATDLENSGPVDQTPANSNPTRRKTSRNISQRMRFKILLRDGFSCQSCGASPLTGRGVELHVDHILPWSSGGETVEENLQAKCVRCNLGKGNAFNK